jgi:predicted SnoaL-like aldol condensation-catalyzing enzyme
MMSIDTNRQNAIDFYEMMFNECEPEKAIAAYVGDQYIQHNPHVESGKMGFIDYFNQMAKEFPGKKVIVKRSIAEGNMVVLHCHQIWPGDLEYAGIDIFRFDEDGKILEHWDVLQVLPAESTHENGMF